MAKVSKEKWLVQQLLRMAEITDDDLKRENYLKQVENLLNDINSKSASNLSPLNISILEFVKENKVDDFVNKTVIAVYQKYQLYCMENGYIPLAPNEFSKQLQRYTDLKTKRKVIDGKKYTIYV